MSPDHIFTLLSLSNHQRLPIQAETWPHHGSPGFSIVPFSPRPLPLDLPSATGSGLWIITSRSLLKMSGTTFGLPGLTETSTMKCPERALTQTGISSLTSIILYDTSWVRYKLWTTGHSWDFQGRRDVSHQTAGTCEECPGLMNQHRIDDSSGQDSAPIYTSTIKDNPEDYKVPVWAREERWSERGVKGASLSNWEALHWTEDCCQCCMGIPRPTSRGLAHRLLPSPWN